MHGAEIGIKNYLFIAVREGNEAGVRGGVTTPSVLTSTGGRCDMRALGVSLVTALVTILPSPSASPAPSLVRIHICRENICGAEESCSGPDETTRR